MCATTPPTQRSFPSDVTAPAAARAFVRKQHCAVHGCDIDACELLVTEAVTNAVRHAGPPIVVSLDCRAGQTDVRVHDGDADILPVLTQARPPASALAHVGDLPEGGRGLDLLELMSSEWGVYAEDDGKTVWFSLSCAA